jgi:SAM-dependent methyltransferase
VGFYRDTVLPWAIDRILGRPEMAAQRAPALRRARGRVLEIGFGSGHSLGSFPSDPTVIQGLVAVEANPGMLARAARRAPSAPFPVVILRGVAENLPFKAASFDTVVSHWTLCSVGDLAAVLTEVRRVLRPDGVFLFLEHGRAEDVALRRRQRRWGPLHRVLAGGCRLDVPIDEAISGAGFVLETLARYEAGPGPRVMTQMYRGAASLPGAGRTR